MLDVRGQQQGSNFEQKGYNYKRSHNTAAALISTAQRVQPPKGQHGCMAALLPKGILSGRSSKKKGQNVINKAATLITTAQRIQLRKGHRGYCITALLPRGKQNDPSRKEKGKTAPTRQQF